MRALTMQNANKTGHILIWSKVKFVDLEPHSYTRKVKEDHVGWKRLSI